MCACTCMWVHECECACIWVCMCGDVHDCTWVCVVRVHECVCVCARALLPKLEDNLWEWFSPTTVSPSIKLRTLDLAPLHYFAVLFSPFLFKGTFISSARLWKRCHFLRIIMFPSSRICTQSLWVFPSQEVTVSEAQGMKELSTCWAPPVWVSGELLWHRDLLLKFEVPFFFFFRICNCHCVIWHLVGGSRRISTGEQRRPVSVLTTCTVFSQGCENWGAHWANVFKAWVSGAGGWVGQEGKLLFHGKS